MVSEQNSGQRARRDEMRSFSGQMLDGIRVVDLSGWAAGTFAATMCAELGADVIAVRPDLDANQPAPSGPGPGANPRPAASDRDLTVDLRDPAGRDLVLRLTDTAGAVVESFRPGHLERIGLGPDVLRERNPRLVVTRISAFGQHGPYRDYEATGLVLQALSGIMRAAGDVSRPPLHRPDLLEEYAVGRAASEATLAGINSARQTGTGAEIDVSGHEVLLSGKRRQAHDDPPVPVPVAADTHPADSHFVQGVYPAAGDDRWVAISIRHDRDWEAVTQVLIAAHITVRCGREWPAGFAEARAATAQGTIGRDAVDARAIRARIAAWTRPRAAADIVATLQAAGVPAGEALTQAQVRADPHLQARGWFTERVR
jgi:crotonobetainyl-CoA:carnitine CoA-transferase CaiB-like acyl-CoA transferase